MARSNLLQHKSLVHPPLERALASREILIVGANEKISEFYDDMIRHSTLDAHVIGYVDDSDRSLRDLPKLGDINSLSAILRNNVVDVVVIGLPVRTSYDRICEVIGVAELHGTPVIFPFGFFENTQSVYAFSNGPWATLTLSNVPTNPTKLFIKHTCDKVLALLALILASPILLLAALLIKLEDGGPVFFRQDRLGYNKRHFKIIKLRSMRVGAEREIVKLEHMNEMDGAGFKISHDPRITKIGRIIRKLSLDELPQLFNVLRGEMSVVGPRPLSVRDYELLPADWQRRRFSMRPGLTCLWQISGRNKTTFEQWMRYDIEYIDNWSIRLDFKIIILTVPEVIRGGGL